MPWPLSQDYNEAIQSPALCFTDPELQQAEAKCNAIGIPMPRSGNFADVYELCGPAGKQWALKCFTRQVPGLRERYAAISAYLKQVDLPFMVDFHYLDPGIKVRGLWYPVLKMDWVEGFSLNTFIKEHADNPPVLEALCSIWTRLARRLREANLAHADLQHGNVLLVPGRGRHLDIKLIDYDGMWVPALARTPSGEVGHPAYQHPRRLREGTYSAEVDRFPHLVIYTALRSVTVGSRYLWNKYDNGDNLLFRQADLAAPAQSPLFRELIQLKDEEVRRLAQALSIAANKPLDQTPLLETLVSEPLTITRVRNRPSASAPAPGTVAEERLIHASKRRRKRLPVGVLLIAVVCFAGLLTGSWWLTNRPGLLSPNTGTPVAQGEPERKKDVAALVRETSKETKSAPATNKETKSAPATKSKSNVPVPTETQKDNDRVPKLVLALKDPSSEVRYRAASELGALGPKGAGASARLTEVLVDPKEEERVRVKAAETIGKIGAAAHHAYPALLRGAAEPSAGLSRAALAALQQTGPATTADIPALATALKSENAVLRAFVVDALAVGNAEVHLAIPVFLQALRDKDKNIRRSALRAVAQVATHAKDRVVPALVELLKDDDDDIRRDAIAGLKSCEPLDPASIVFLTDALRSKVAEVRAYAASALGKIGPAAKDAGPVLVLALLDADQEVCAQAGSAVGKIGVEPKVIVQALGAALKNPEAPVRQRAARALGDKGPEAKDAVPALGEALKDTDKAVRSETAQSLGKIGPEAKAAIPELVDALKDADPGVCASVASTLGKLGPEVKPSIPKLAALLDDPALRRNVLDVLLAIGSDGARAAAPTLAKMVADREPAVSESAEKALLKMGPDAKAAVPALARLLRSETLDSRRRIIRVLRAIGSDAGGATGALILTLDDTALGVPAAVAKMPTDGTATVEKFDTLLSELELVQTILKVGTPAVAPLGRMLTTEKDNANMRLAAAIILGKIGPDARDAIPALELRVKLDTFPEIRAAASSALLKIRSK